jgi:hypothetical protein
MEEIVNDLKASSREIALMVSLIVFALVARGWNEVRSLESSIPAICFAALAIWAIGVGIWAILELRDKGQLSKPALVGIIVIVIGIFAV